MCKGVGLVTRGSVCCLSSSRCSNIFFFVMMPNTILKTNIRLMEDCPDEDKTREKKTKTCRTKKKVHNLKYQTGRQKKYKNSKWQNSNTTDET